MPKKRLPGKPQLSDYFFDLLDQMISMRLEPDSTLMC
jgi:hypothetical protein